jgi:SHS2 domain-containing protein
MYKPDATKYQEIEHTADIGIVVVGATAEDVFANAAFGMLSIIYYRLPQQGQSKRSVDLVESNLPDLLVRWLSEINYLLTVHNFLPVNILQLQIKEINQTYQLQALITGSDSKLQQNEIRTEIKAVTYHQLRLDRNEQGYSTRIIFDI